MVLLACRNTLIHNATILMQSASGFTYLMSFMLNFLIVMLGSGLGGGCRYLVSLLFNHSNYEARFYLTTFTVNSVGSLLIGIIFALLTKGSVGDKAALLMVTGFMGGFTTFSSFSLENLRLLQQGDIAASVIYSVSSVLLGISLAALGYWLGKSV